MEDSWLRQHCSLCSVCCRPDGANALVNRNEGKCGDCDICKAQKATYSKWSGGKLESMSVFEQQNRCNIDKVGITVLMPSPSTLREWISPCFAASMSPVPSNYSLLLCGNSMHLLLSKFHIPFTIIFNLRSIPTTASTCRPVRILKSADMIWVRPTSDAHAMW